MRRAERAQIRQYQRVTRIVEGEPHHIHAVFTRWAVAHPVWWGLVTAAEAFVVAWILFGGANWAAWLAASVAFGLVNLALWRPGGPGHRLRTYLLRRFPKERRQQ